MAHRKAPGSQGSAEDEEAIEKQPWYWGDLQRDEASELLENGEPGQFLVRDSAQEGQYTLVIKTRDGVRCVRILKWDGRFGIVFNECTFRSVVSVVNHLRRRPSLLHANYPHLNLARPLCRVRPRESVATHVMLRQLVAKNKESTLLQHGHEELVQQKKDATKNIQLCEQALKSLNVVLILYQDHLETNTEVHKHLSMDEITSLVDNKRLVHDRVHEVNQKLEEHQTTLKDLRDKEERLLVAVSDHVPMLTILKAEQGQLRRRVEERGIEKEYLDLLLQEERDVDIRHLDIKFWYLPDCDRTRAEHLLAERVPGTFLVRPSSKPGDGNLALSVVSVYGDYAQTNHCIIFYHPQQGYGFHPDYCIFSTLNDLVIKHRALSLRFYNDKLDVCLTYPVNYQHDDSHTWNIN